MSNSTSGVTSLLLRDSDVRDGTAIPAAYCSEYQCTFAITKTQQYDPSSARPLWVFYSPYARVCIRNGRGPRVLDGTQYSQHKRQLTI